MTHTAVATLAMSRTRAQTRRHDWIDERSRALGVAVGKRLREDPALISIALERLALWDAAAQGRGDARVIPALRAWRDILEQSTVESVIAMLADTSARSRRLRQSTPFVDALSTSDRAAIFAEFEAL